MNVQLARIGEQEELYIPPPPTLLVMLDDAELPLNAQLVRVGEGEPVLYIPPPLPSSWTPPPPPAYPSKPQQTLAVASFILGMVSVTIGWCCSFGVLTAPIALVLGIVSLVQIKNDPAKNGGKGFAIGGIVTGGLYFVVFALIILLYGIGIFMGALR